MTYSNDFWAFRSRKITLILYSTGGPPSTGSALIIRAVFELFKSKICSKMTENSSNQSEKHFTVVTGYKSLQEH